LQGASLSELEVLYRERFAEFRRVAAAIVGDYEAARDVVQDAFGSAIRRRASFRREGPLEAWVWRTVVNTARDHRRQAEEAPFRSELRRLDGSVQTNAQAEPTRSEGGIASDALAALRTEHGSSESSHNGHSPLVDRVAAAIALLPERQRLVLFLRYYADLDYAAIADTLDITAGTVAATLNAARTALRRTLQEVQR
jgi:RNA polymerase sigma-70 factor, ECF subfamily